MQFLITFNAPYTIIRKFFIVKKLSFHPKQRSVLHEYYLPIVLYVPNIWHTCNIDEILLHENFSNMKYLRTKIMRITVHVHAHCTAAACPNSGFH